MRIMGLGWMEMMRTMSMSHRYVYLPLLVRAWGFGLGEVWEEVIGVIVWERQRQLYCVGDVVA